MAKRKHIDDNDWLKGLNAVISSIQEKVDRIQQGSSQGLKDALLMVAEKSQERAPVESGDLRGSVSVEIDDIVIAKGNKDGGLSTVAEAPENGTVGTVSYNTPYAADQHEHTEYDHPKGGQAKYLESVLVEESETILRLISGAAINHLEE